MGEDVPLTWRQVESYAETIRQALDRLYEADSQDIDAQTEAYTDASIHVARLMIRASQMVAREEAGGDG